MFFVCTLKILWDFLWFFHKIAVTCGRCAHRQGKMGASIALLVALHPLKFDWTQNKKIAYAHS